MKSTDELISQGVGEQGDLNGDHSGWIRVVEDVQRKIGQDLHDGVEQELVGLGMISQALLKKLQSERQWIDRDSISSCEELARKLVEGFTRAHEDLQSISRGLIPTNGFHDNLPQALRDLAARTNDVQGIACSFRCDPKVVLPRSEIALQIYRIAQEAVCNALKHSGASHILIALDGNGDKTILKVADNGRGFHDPQPNNGIGLDNMQYRAKLIGAKLEITTVPSGGTLVCCTLGDQQHA
jgi:two-component system CheB/CheR fusion protein